MTVKSLARLVGGFFFAFGLAASMGAGCISLDLNGFPFPVSEDDDVIIIPDPDPVVIVPDVVTIELVNTTEFPVNPFLYASPYNDIFFPEDIAFVENFVDIGEPLAPGEVVTLDLDCFDAGTLHADGDLLLSPDEAVFSLTAPILRDAEHFICGDLVSFVYYDDPTVGFFTEAEVNGVIIPQQ